MAGILDERSEAARFYESALKPIELSCCGAAAPLPVLAHGY